MDTVIYTFGKYTLIKEIGAGSFSQVFLAHQKSTGQKVAIKVLSQDDGSLRSSEETRVVRFKREMTLCSTLYHPNIIKVLDFGETEEKKLFIVFEYIPGISLADLIKKEGALTVLRTREIMLQLLAAIESAHAKGVIHRDIKPDNIMIMTGAAGDVVKLVDFGIATFTAATPELNITLTQDFLGTPVYAAPEQLRGEKISYKIDLFSWGLIYLECLSGENAYNESNPAQLLQRKLSSSSVPLPVSLSGTAIGVFLNWVLEKTVKRRAAETSEVLKRFKKIEMDDLLLDGGYLNARESTYLKVSKVESNPLEVLDKRKITVLMCDLFLEPSSAVSPQLSDSLYRNTLSFCRTEAVKNGAYIAESSAGRIVCYFGYPSSIDSHNRNGAKAALGIVSSLVQSVKILKVEHQAKLTWSVALHSGELTVSRLEGKECLFGVVLGEASRLCKLTAENEIYASEKIYQGLKKNFNFQEVKSNGALINYRLTGIREQLSLFDRFQPEDSLVGRRDVLQELGVLRTRSEEIGQTVIISGEAGIGKSRLLAESISVTTIEKASIVELMCYPENKNSALAPFLSFLKIYYKIDSFEDSLDRDQYLLAELAECSFDLKSYLSLLYYWLGINSSTFGPLSISPQKQKEQFLTMTVSLFFESIFQDQTILIFEDIHWIDPTSEELLSLMLQEVPQHNCLFMMTARPEFTSPWDKKLTNFIDLKGLKEDGVELLIRRGFKGREISEELILKMISKVNGNPLFAEEMVKSFHDQDLGISQIYQDEITIPENLDDLFSAKLNRIGVAKLTAQLASVIGPRFQYDLLREIFPDDESVLLADLTQLLVSGFIHVIPRTDVLEYAFDHALIGDNAYQSIPLERCQQIHAKLAELIEAGICEDGDEDKLDFNTFREELRDVSFHYMKCENYEKSLKYQTLAGEQVFQICSYKEAIKYFEAAIFSLAKQSSEDLAKNELSLHIKLGLSLKSVHGWAHPKAVESYAAAMRLSEGAGGSGAEELAPMIFGHWASVMMELKLREALKLARNFLSFAEKINNQEVLMQAHMAMANNLYWLGDLTETELHVQKSLRYYKGLDSKSLIKKGGVEPVTIAQMFHVFCVWGRGEAEESDALMNKYLDFSLSLDHSFSLAVTLQVATWHYYHRGNTDECLKYALQLIDLSERHDFSFYLGVGQMFKAWALSMGGDFHVNEIVEAYKTKINPNNSSFLHSIYSCLLGEVLLCQDDAEEAKVVLEKGLETAFENEELPYSPELYRLLAEAAFVLNDDEKGFRCLEKSIEQSRVQGMLFCELKAVLDYTTGKLIEKDTVGISLLKELLKKFVNVNSDEIQEARELLLEYT